MNTITQPMREIPIISNTDVLVIGGGPAGIAAAVAASRTGADVLLVERYGSLGGMVSGGIVLQMDGLICAGRCISVDADLIHSIRAIAPCIMTGQAAGTAAALCVQMDVAPRDLDAETLRTQLAKDGAILPYYKGE